ncbi:hypothetical protein J4Q44_G00346730 [Coregonus suidteri]|uniref:Uncharacterized protein n=1 Tax=Coregonus suidteri TaxID=861788 RepID=A0AAN8QMU5_9TELE
MDFLAGCIGGAAGVLVGHPFDTVKKRSYCVSRYFFTTVRLQVQNVDKPLYRGTYHCFQSIVRQESMFGLYKGIGSPMMGLTFINAIVFGVHGNTMRYLGHDTPMNQFLAGAAAGAIQCVICCPMELAKTRMQMQGCTAACTHRRYPTTGRHGGFDLLRFRSGPVHPSLDDLVVPGSPRNTISIPNLVRTPVRHTALQPRAPQLIRSTNLSLPVTWITGTRHRARRETQLQVTVIK